MMYNTAERFFYELLCLGLMWVALLWVPPLVAVLTDIIERINKKRAG